MNFFSSKRRSPPPSAAAAPPSVAVPESLSPTTPGVTAEGHSYQLYDFFAFRGVLFGRGLVEHAVGDRPRLTLWLHDKTWLAAPYVPDPFHPTTETSTGFSFAVPLPPGTNGEQTSLIALFIHFRNEHLNISNPAWERLQNDRFVSSEPPFWEALKSTPNGRVLEIGSRARSGITRRNLFPTTMEYVGFDISAGPNVDVVGDAHLLSTYFPPEHFDAAISISVWEHLAMPWVVSLELNRVLKTGGVAMINTHQSWPAHEEPWDYFRFSEHSWPSLFNAATGFEILGCGMGFPAVMVSALAIPHLQDQKVEWHYGYLATRCVVRKIGPTKLEWPVDPKLAGSGQYTY